MFVKKIFAAMAAVAALAVLLTACGPLVEDPNHNRILENAGIRYVTFDANGAEGNAPRPMPANTTYAWNNSVRLPWPGELTKDNHSFHGWNTCADGNSDNNFQAGDSFTVTGNVTLYAQWR